MMRSDVVLAIVSALLGIGASLAVTFGTTLFPNVPSWLAKVLFWGGVTVSIVSVGILLLLWTRSQRKPLAAAVGGRGGNAAVTARNSIAIGGRGGRGGAYGLGGDGGNAVALGDNSIAMGGEGGEAGQADGRGGRGGRSPLEVLGLGDLRLPDGTRLGDYGRGGDGANAPTYKSKKPTTSTQ